MARGLWGGPLANSRPVFPEQKLASYRGTERLVFLSLFRESQKEVALW